MGLITTTDRRQFTPVCGGSEVGITVNNSSQRLGQDLDSGPPLGKPPGHAISCSIFFASSWSGLLCCAVIFNFFVIAKHLIDTKYYTIVLYRSGSLLGMYNLDKRTGNTGTLGSYFWRIENQERDSDTKKCIDWITFQDDVKFRFWYDQQFRSQSSNRRLACPCTIWQAFLDRGRFFLDRSYSSSNFCFRSRSSRIFFHIVDDLAFAFFRIRQLCCFSDLGFLITGPPDGSHVIAERICSVREVTTDKDAKTFCCADPDLCNEYYFYRPSDDCSFYRPRRRRKFLLLCYPFL